MRRPKDEMGPYNPDNDPKLGMPTAGEFFRALPGAASVAGGRVWERLVFPALKLIFFVVIFLAAIKFLLPIL